MKLFKSKKPTSCVSGKSGSGKNKYCIQDESSSSSNGNNNNKNVETIPMTPILTVNKTLKAKEIEKILEDPLSEKFDDFSSGSDDNYEPSNESLDEDEDEHVAELEQIVESCEPEPQLENVASTSKAREAKPLTRKKVRNENEWIQNKRKTLRNSGQEYETKNGKLIKGKNPKPCVCSCECFKKIDENARISISKSYWSLSSYEKQRMFINSTVLQKSCQRKLVKDSRRNFSFQYFLNGEKVCKKFYISTLNVSDGAVMYVKKKERTGVPVDKNRRGKTKNAKKIGENTIESIKEHIKSFPAVESHYNRKNSKKLYLASDLNLKKMYDLYIEKNSELSQGVKEHLYRKIFNTQFNYSFHIPKKDACKKCEIYKNALDKSSLEIDYNQHISDKNFARKEKESDKYAARENTEIKVYTFDLQSVLYAPCSNVSSFYYTRKFASYNLTLYDLKTKQGYCNFWMEIDGERGSDEIGSILLKHLNTLPKTIKHVILYSDCCGGQNRNRYIAALLAYCNKVLNFDSINIKYLESGLTQMEVDSMHSTIEKAKKGINIFSPTEWPTILRIAKRKCPYIVQEIKFSDFYDLKHLFAGLHHDLKNDSTGKKISWLKVKCLKVSKVKPNVIEYKIEWLAENFSSIDLTQIKKKRSTTLKINLELKNKYEKQLAISNLKKQNLVSLCSSGLLPNNATEFYESLQDKEVKKSRLEEPNYSEYETDED